MAQKFTKYLQSIRNCQLQLNLFYYNYQLFSLHGDWFDSTTHHMTTK